MPEGADTSTIEAPAGSRTLRWISLLLAAACGLSVANIYYTQPLLDLIAKAFHTSQGSATVVVTMTQLGYAIGLIVLLPLGDLLENRALASRTLLVTAAALVLAATASDMGVFLAASVLVGTTSVVAQILVPLAAHLAPEGQRGYFVGRVMSGLLLGILLARTLSSLVAAAWGWRSVFAISAGLMVVMAGVLAVALARRRPDHTAGYPQLMASIGSLARSEPILRRRALGQALMFGAFSSFWTSIAYELIDAHSMSQTGIGIFALVGAAGAAAAPIAGRLGDRGHSRIATGAAFALATGAMALAGLGAGSVVLLAAAGVVLDLAVQSHQVLSQRDIYQLRPDARARINTVFMGSVFLGGALASGVSGLLHDRFGWSGVTAFGAILPAIGFALWTVGQSRSNTGTAD